MMVDSFSIRIYLDDIHFHLALDGNKRCNVLDNESLKGKITNQGCEN
jgi:hypothetical protein